LLSYGREQEVRSMSKSPGHREHPDHKVAERRLSERIRVAVNGETIADSSDVIKVEEDGSPPRYYFPRGDVAMKRLQSSPTTSQMPVQGNGHILFDRG
jgi:uncharacterized protein (DUF427 family)